MRALIAYKITPARPAPLRPSGLRVTSRIVPTVCLATLLAPCVFAAEKLTWQELEAKFDAVNPTLKAAQDNITEARDEEITAYLRPNPDFSVTTDGFQVTSRNGLWQPLGGVYEVPSFSYLHERDHKRELRLKSAQENTAVTASQYQDQRRSLLYTLRSSYVQVLQAKAILQNAQENLAYWDHELTINHDRYVHGDLAEIDYDRLVLQRAQFESDYETALVNLRGAKIQLLQLMNDRTPIEEFDVVGLFDFFNDLKPLAEYRNAAMANRPDLRAAVQTVQMAKTNYQLAVSNGSTDPTFSVWFTHNASTNNPNAYDTVGGSISIPLRIFDRNQGEKARTLVDITRSERLQTAAELQVLSDVDSAYVTVNSALNLLRPYKDRYVALATAVRDKVTFAYRNGGSSLLDYLDAEKAYRDVKLAYINLIGSYMTAAAQMNMAVGQEVIE